MTHCIIHPHAPFARTARRGLTYRLHFDSPADRSVTPLSAAMLSVTVLLPTETQYPPLLHSRAFACAAAIPQVTFTGRCLLAAKEQVEHAEEPR